MDNEYFLYDQVSVCSLVAAFPRPTPQLTETRLGSVVRVLLHTARVSRSCDQAIPADPQNSVHHIKGQSESIHQRDPPLHRISQPPTI